MTDITTVAAQTRVLKPGDVAVATRGERLETLLGSCVAVVLTDPRRTVGAMCHIVHASEPPRDADGDTAFARCAMERLFADLRRLGIAPELCEARVYGGGNMFPQFFSERHVGAVNTRWVLAFLGDVGMDVRAQSIGGACYRKLGWTVGPDEPECTLVDVVDGPH